MKKVIVVVSKCLLFCMIMTLCNMRVCADESPQPLYTFEGAMEIIPPQTTKYYDMQRLVITGLVVYEMAGIKYSDGSTKITYRKEIKDPEIDLLDKPLSCDDKYVTVKGWSEKLSAEISGEFEIIVKSIPDRTPSICFDGGVKIIPSYKTDYIEGEYLDLTGMEVYEVSGTIYKDGSKDEITKKCRS